MQSVQSDDTTAPPRDFRLIGTRLPGRIELANKITTNVHAILVIMCTWVASQTETLKCYEITLADTNVTKNTTEFL